VHLDDWSEDFVLAQARSEDLELTDEHWQVIHFLRDYYAEHAVQAQVRAMIRHFQAVWGPERGNNHYLHDLFPGAAAKTGQPPGRLAEDQRRTLRQSCGTDRSCTK